MSRHQQGFTLVEILVALVILSSVTLIASSAFSLFSKRWDGQLGRFDASMQQIKTRLLVQDIVENITPYVATSADGKERLYFEGNRNGFVAVSLRSLQDPSIPAVIRLSTIQRNDFSFDLIYEEWPMVNGVLVQSGVALDFNPPILMYSGLKDVTFRYFGVPSTAGVDSIAEANDAIGGGAPQWFENYNSLATFRQPMQLEISWLAQDSSDYARQQVVMIRPTGGQTGMTTEEGL